MLGNEQVRFGGRLSEKGHFGTSLAAHPTARPVRGEAAGKRTSHPGWHLARRPTHAHAGLRHTGPGVYLLPAWHVPGLYLPSAWSCRQAAAGAMVAEARSPAAGTVRAPQARRACEFQGRPFS
jgi:hypothetical protein